MMNSNLYKEAAKLCKFMKRMADLQQKHKLMRIRLSFNNDEFPHPDMDDEERFNSYNYLISQKIRRIVMLFCHADKHFRPENSGKPGDSIYIQFIMKKAEEEKIIFDKSNLLNKNIKVYIYIKNGELNYNEDVSIFIEKYINKTFEQLHLTNREEYNKIVNLEKYTKEEWIKMNRTF